MVVGIACKGGYLLHIANKEQESGGGAGGSGVGVLRFDVVGNAGGGGPQSWLAGINNVRDESFAAFPFHESVEQTAERIVRYNKIAYGGRRYLAFFRRFWQFVYGVCRVEKWRVMQSFHSLGAFNVGIVEYYFDFKLCAYLYFAAYGIVAYWGEIQCGQVLVAGYAAFFEFQKGVGVESVG